MSDIAPSDPSPPSAAALAALLGRAGEGALLVASDGRVTYANEAAARALGWAGDVLRGRRLIGELLTDGDVADRLSAAIAHLRAAGVRSTTFRAPLGEGVAEWEVCAAGTSVGVLIRRAGDGGAAGTASAGRTTAALVPPPGSREAVADLAFGPLADEVPVGVILCDAHGLVVYANPQLGVTTGRATRELKGAGLARAIHADDLPRVAEKWRAFIEAGAPDLRDSYRVVRRSGEERTVSVVVRCVRERDGAVAGFVAIVEDVTDALRAADDARKSQRLEAIGQLAGGLAHEFNNLLTIIRGNLAFARAGVVPGSAVHEDLAEVDRAAERAAALVRQLLAVARRQILRPLPLDVRTVVRDAIPRLRALCAADMLLDVTMVREPCVVRADAAQLQQVLSNLVANACDAMPGGGTIGIETHLVTLDARMAREWGGLDVGTYVRLTVRDTGVGMEEATRARAFEPFFTTKPPGAAMGLGLAVVHGIVAQSGGAVRVESAPGRGTAVTALLRRIGEGAERATIDLVPGGAETVLVAEGSPALRAALARLLAARGYAVEAVASAAEALDRVRAGAPALVVAGGTLAEADAATIAWAMRDHAARTPLVLVTRLGDAHDRDGHGHGHGHGNGHGNGDGDAPATWHIRAPVLGRELLAVVRAALDAELERVEAS